jgi:hypothetical protein
MTLVDDRPGITRIGDVRTETSEHPRQAEKVMSM